MCLDTTNCNIGALLRDGTLHSNFLEFAVRIVRSMGSHGENREGQLGFSSAFSLAPFLLGEEITEPLD